MKVRRRRLGVPSAGTQEAKSARRPGLGCAAVGQALVGQLITDPAAFRGRRDQPALAQAGQVVGQVRPAGPELLGTQSRS
jgi:hypothetical protein